MGKISFNLSSNPIGAKVSLKWFPDKQNSNFKWISLPLTTPCIFDFDVGVSSSKYDVIFKFELDGYNEYQSQVYKDLCIGNTLKLNYILTPTGINLESGFLSCNSTPLGANIYIDGVDSKLFTNSILHDISVGEHVVKFVKSGYTSQEKVVNVLLNETSTVNMILPTNTSAPVTGSIYVNSAPFGMGIYLDNVRTNYFTPYTILNVSSGIHTVKLNSPGYKTYKTTVTVTPGSVSNIIATMSPAIPPNCGSMLIESDPSGAMITIDGHLLGRTPNPCTYLDYRVYEVKFSYPGYVDLIKKVNINSVTKDVSVHGVLQFGSGIDPKTSGYLQVKSIPTKSNIYIEYNNAMFDSGFVTPHKFKINPGTYKVKVEHAGYSSSITTSTVSALSTTTITPKLVKVPSTARQVLIFIQDFIYSGAKYEIDRYSNDISLSLGCGVKIISKPEWTSPVEIKNIMRSYYDSGTLIGSVFIGNFPVMTVTNPGSSGTYPTDWYYQDFVDSFSNIHPITKYPIYMYRNDEVIDDIYGYISNQRQAWLGRISPPRDLPTSDQVLLVKSYFNKNHAYRIGNMQYNGILYYNSLGVSGHDDIIVWEETGNGIPWIESNYRTYYADIPYAVYMPDDPVTILWCHIDDNGNNLFLNEIPKPYKLDIVSVHGSSESCYPEETPKCPNGSGHITIDNIISNGGYGALLTINYACSNGDFINSNHCFSATSIFYGTGLVMTGSITSLFGTVPYKLDDAAGIKQYRKLTAGTIGDWHKTSNEFGLMCLFGDPTLRL